MKRPDEQWRMPELERFGARLREAELAERAASPRLRSRLTSSGFRRGILGVLGALAAAGAVLEIVAPAGARSPVNKAPLAAERSGSARFSSRQRITVDGRRVTSIRESGELDFVTGAFATSLIVGETAEPIERRRIGSTLYLRRVPAGEVGKARAKWTEIRVDPRSVGTFSVPGGYTLIDPQVVFRVMAATRSPTMLLGQAEMDGVRTAHYRISTSLDAFVAAEQGQASSKASPARTATLDVWLDRRGRPVRVVASFLGGSGTHRATMTTGVDFTAYGRRVSVRAPASDEIAPESVQSSPSTLGDPARAAERLLGLLG